MKNFWTLSLICIGLCTTATPALAAGIVLPEGSLIKAGYPEVFLVTGQNILRWIPDEETFNALGYAWDSVTTISNEDLKLYTFGPAMAAVPAEPKLSTPAENKIRVAEYFADVPEMVDIAACESEFRQFNNDGTPLRGYGLYVGIFQIDEKIHADWAKSLGMDIFTVEGNLAYARRLYEESGFKPWPTCARTTGAIPAVTQNLQLGDENSEVKFLQKILNKAGFTITAAGPGSPGNETDYFGELTRQAVQRFQCAKNIVCSGDEGTTGYGLVGPKTRAVLTDV